MYGDDNAVANDDGNGSSGCSGGSDTTSTEGVAVPGKTRGRPRKVTTMEAI